MSEKTYVCRCEDVTLKEIHKLIDEGMEKAEEIKRYTRCTMGSCQGNTCRNILSTEIAKKTSLPIKEVDVPTFRAPIKPIKLGTIVGGETDE